ncbi:MAG: enoyl-ACP reductase [Deltaproteobacteria bacterium]|nr:enoyl-ACP reductase [Deltaproteobacteria bacterium]
MLLKDKKALIFGVANDKSIAYALAKSFKEQGASLAMNYPGESILKRMEPLSKELGSDFIFPCDVTKDSEIDAAVDLVRERWGRVDILVHSVAFANREDLKGRTIDTSRDGFHLALDVSAYSLLVLCRAFEPLLTDRASIMTLTYNGSQRALPGYNIMGVAKATLEAIVRYLACDLGPRGIRVNAISAGPIKTLAATGISGFRNILSHVEEIAPLHRNVTQEDVAGTGLYLASDLSTAVTGSVLFVDSGHNIMTA